MYRKIQAARGSASGTEATVYFVTENGRDRWVSDLKNVDSATKALLNEIAKRPECAGKSGEVTVETISASASAKNTSAKKTSKTNKGLDGCRLLVVGLGKRDSLSEDRVRAAASGLLKTLDRLRVEQVTIIAPGKIKALTTEGFGRALGEGLGLANFEVQAFKALTKSTSKPMDLKWQSDEKSFSLGLSDGVVLSESVNFARQWAATPPNIATTSRIAAEARKLARENKSLICRVYQSTELEKHQLVGLINVGKASENPPCMVELMYKPTGKSSGTVLLVGKTIVYDTGGLSLKSGNGMKGMKYDKCGGMAVLGAMHAVTRLKPQCKVIALMPTAENSVSDEAYRPDDILTYPNGVTVEVTNTDAEGRLVLADALAFGCRKHKPDAIIDLATLTGGVVVALGDVCAGLWCDDDGLRKKLEQAADASGERLWRLPLHDEYKEMMKSQHADIWNSAPVRQAHPIQGAAFLSYFVDESIPWAHIDIAGVASLDKERAPYSSGPTGYGVRLLSYLLKAW